MFQYLLPGGDVSTQRISVVVWKMWILFFYNLRESNIDRSRHSPTLLRQTFPGNEHGCEIAEPFPKLTFPSNSRR